MTTALLCDKWTLPCHFDNVSEGETQRTDRSYIHYAVTHPEFVSAKCWATEWLFKDSLPEGQYSAIEYLAGVGVQSTILRNTINLSEHLVLERDENCVKHLKQLGFNSRSADARKSMKTETDFDIKLADFPSSSVISVDTKWKGFRDMFDSSTSMIAWTDTAISYPLGIHGKKYGAKFGVGEIRTKEEYIENYADWINRELGYTLTKAAIRGTNAIYFLAKSTPSNLSVEEFPFSGPPGFVFQ